MEEWWQKYAYLQTRDSLLLSFNFVGNWIPVGHSTLHEMVEKNTTMENRRSKSISYLLYQVCRYWSRLRSQSIVPFRDGSGKTYSMHQSKFLFNTSRYEICICHSKVNCRKKYVNLLRSITENLYVWPGAEYLYV